MISRRENSFRRIAVFSDTHGNKKYMREVLSEFPSFDCIIHLGDGVADGRDVSAEFNVPFCGIYGNEDYGSDYPETLLLSIDCMNIYFMHGHQFEINAYQTKNEWDKHFKEFADLAEINGAAALFFGHTHKAVLEKYNGIIICNPGDQYIGSMVSPAFAEVKYDPEAKELTIYLHEKLNDGWMIKQTASVI